MPTLLEPFPDGPKGGSATDSGRQSALHHELNPERHSSADSVIIAGRLPLTDQQIQN